QARPGDGETGVTGVARRTARPLRLPASADGTRVASRGTEGPVQRPRRDGDGNQGRQADADAQQRLYHARREIPAPDKEGGKDAAGRNQKIAPGAVTSNLRLPPKSNSLLAIRLLL